MSKRIIFCSDGSWSAIHSQTTFYEITNTNVLKMFRATALEAPNQMAFYQSGVGCNKRIHQRLLQSFRGGSLGAGIDRKIKQGYMQIAKAYKPGDVLYFFGWSRGAYTVRSLVSMICEFGLPTKSFDYEMVNELFLVYRNPINRKNFLEYLEKKYDLYKPYIQFVGVLDTVGSLGIPAIHGGVSQPRYGFLNTNLHPNILNAYQAIAIDECRQQFPITMWNEPSPPVKGQVCEQIYFAGCHGDVGGGFPELQAGLSEIPLQWMAKKANALGLDIHPNLLVKDSVISIKQALSPIHESWSPKCGRREYRTIADDAMLSNSVAIRCEQDLTYRPKNLNFVNGKLSPSYRIIKVLD